jgi:hypothetical protein
MGARCGLRYRRHSEVNTPVGASGTPEPEKTMQYVYRCTRCNTGWLATKVEPSGQGWAVHIFICNRCRYASQPGELLAMQEGGGTLLASVHAAIVPVARLTGPEVEFLRMAEICALLGLLSDAPQGEAQKYTLAGVGSMAGV